MGLLIALLQTPPLGLGFTGEFTWLPRDIIMGIWCLLHVWAPNGPNSLAQSLAKPPKRHNGPLGLLLVRFGTWRNPCPSQEGFRLAVFAYMALWQGPFSANPVYFMPRLSPCGFHPCCLLVDASSAFTACLRLESSPRSLVSVGPAEGPRGIPPTTIVGWWLLKS